MCLTSGFPEVLGPILERHPGLTLVMGLVSTAMASHATNGSAQATADQTAVAWPGFSTALQKKLSQARQAESKRGGN